MCCVPFNLHGYRSHELRSKVLSLELIASILQNTGLVSERGKEGREGGRERGREGETVEERVNKGSGRGGREMERGRERGGRE